MPAPTNSWSASETVQSPSTGDDTRTFSATIGANSRAVVVVVAASAGGADVEFATVDGVTIPLVPGASLTDGTNRVAIHVLTDLTGVTHPGSIVVELVHGTGTYLIWVGVLDHAADLVIFDSGEDPGTTPWAAALDSGGEAGLALAGMAKTGGQDIADGGGQTRLATAEFITINDEAISSKLITGAGSMSFTASGGDGVMGAVLLGGVDTALVMTAPIAYAWGVQAGITLEAPADVLLSPEAPIRYGWGVQEGIRLVGSTGKRQVAIVAGGIEGAEPTTGGTEGQLLTQHADRPPSWEAPPTGVTDHGALTGLGDDDHASVYSVLGHTHAGGAGMGVPIVRVYGTSGSPHTWTKPAGLVALLVEVVGGGGGSGGCATTVASQGAGAAGGGGGGGSRKMFDAAALPSTCTITVGAGGAAGAAGNNAGSPGGASSFAGAAITTVQGNGGGGGGGGAAAGAGSRTIAGGGAGGTGSGGDVQTTGGDGSNGHVIDGIGLLTGDGGGSMLGSPQRSGAAAVAGQPYGGGSGAGGIGPSTTQIAGAAGADGVVIVTEYY